MSICKFSFISIILIFALFFSLNFVNTTYKFTYHEEKNPIIDKLNQYAHKDLSIATVYRNKTTKQAIKNEFFTLTNDYDIALLPAVTDKTFLFSAIEFKQPAKGIINISYKYNGEDLPVIAEYIYHYPRTSDGKTEKNKKFIVSETNGSTFDEGERFIYVRIYKAPKFNSYLPKYFWFNDSMTQSVHITFEDGGEKQLLDYEFDLKWKKTWSAFYQIMYST